MNEKLRDLDNTISELLISLLYEYVEWEDNSIHIKDKLKILELIGLLKQYRDGYGELYNNSSSVSEWNNSKKKKYNRMFLLLKNLFTKLII